MAFANSAYSDILSTTIAKYSKTCADNLTNNNALLNVMRKRGSNQDIRSMTKDISGGAIILQNIFYNDPTTNYATSFSGYDPINISPDSPISAAQFMLKQYAEAVTISGTEQLQNMGPEAVIDLLATRTEIAFSRLENRIDLDLHGDGTGNGGKNIVGLAAMLSTSPTSGVYGGIDRATWSFWRNGAYTATSTLGAPATAATIQKLMNIASLGCVRGKDFPDFIYAGTTAYSMFLESLQAIQRVTNDDEMASAGFSSLSYMGAGGKSRVVLGGGVGGNQTATRMDFINTKYVHWRPHSDRNFVEIGGNRESINQDALVKLIGWAGALTSSGPQYCATASIL